MPKEAAKSGLPARRLAWGVLEAVAAGAYADVALERALRQHRLSPADRGLTTELAYGCIRWRQWLDGWLNRLGKIPAHQQPPRLRWLLHLGLYQLLRMQRIPAAAAVDTTVELAKRHGFSRLSAVVNGVLRSALRAKDAGETLPCPEQPAERMALCHSLPVWLTENLLEWFEPDQAERVAIACNQVPPLDLRVNRLRRTPDAVAAALAEAGVPTQPIDGSPDGLQVLAPAGDLRLWPGFEQGHWSVQDRSAQWVAPLLAPQPGDRILDACAAPGGKATHLAELIGDVGEIWAVDRSAGRLKRVAMNASRLGCGCIKAMAANAADLLERQPDWLGSFQRILLDVPCSGLGTLSRHPDARWRVTAETVEELLPLQARLLDAMLPLLAPGGRLVYATCTIHPAENCAQVQRFLHDHMDFHLLSEQQSWPDPEGGDGFYAAVITAPAKA